MGRERHDGERETRWEEGGTMHIGERAGGWKREAIWVKEARPEKGGQVGKVQTFTCRAIKSFSSLRSKITTSPPMLDTTKTYLNKVDKKDKPQQHNTHSNMQVLPNIPISYLILSTHRQKYFQRFPPHSVFTYFPLGSIWIPLGP